MNPAFCINAGGLITYLAIHKRNGLTVIISMFSEGGP